MVLCSKERKRALTVKANGFCILAILLGWSLIGQGQAPAATPKAEPSTGAAMPAKAVPVRFHSDLLDLSFTYPGSMTAKALPSLEEQHAQTIAKYPNETAEEKRTDECSDVALRAAREDDPNKATGTVAFYGDKRGAEFHIDPVVKAKLVISRIGIKCMPEKYRDNPDGVAIGLAQTSAEGKDLKAIDQPGYFDFGKLHIHFEAAETAAPAKPEDKQWIVSTAFISNGSVVSIYFESNDLAFLNEMISGEITIGKEHGARFFPADIGNGTPITYKP